MRFRSREWFRRWRETFRHRGDSETEEELRFHLGMAEQEALRRGQDAREARLRAGGVAQAAEAVRDQGTIRWLSDFLRDSRHGTRLLARTPVFTAAAIVSLALGIGANTAIFSLMDAVILRMMPVHEPEAARAIWTLPFLSVVSSVPPGAPLFHRYVCPVFDGPP